MNNELINAAITYIDHLFHNNTDGHDAAHSLRVYRTAMQIAGHEPDCDLQTVALAALLHDVDDHKLFQTENNENARRFLGGHPIAPSEVEHICEVINSVSFSRNRGRKPATLEGKIVQDADRLDAIGAIGIARAFQYGGKNRQPMENTVQHFYDKLLRIKDEMNTQWARKIAESRHDFLVSFLETLRRETEQ